ncbi:MAG TPA: serine/threonine-protein kinase, partial [Nannocystis sp.]
MQAQPRAPGHSAEEAGLDSEGPTREDRAAGGPRFAAQAATDDVRKASLLTGTGARIGRFHVLRLIGEGGMGMVFAAYDEELDRKVAIKLLRNLPGEGSIGRTRLLREAQALARLSHPNVVTVYEVGEFEQQVFIAMEFVLGDTLYKWLRDGARPWREVVRVFIEAGRGLAVAHAAGILHRDFKPANVLLGTDGRVRVLDFGLALAQGRRDGDAELVGAHSGSSSSMRQEALTEAGAVLGTPAYMAPERYIAGRTVDARVDQFSFCVALHEALYGARPFPGREYAELRKTILRGTIPEAPRGSKVPKWLRRVVLRGLALDPANRFPDMEALLVALQRDPDRTRRLVFAGLGVGAVLIAGGYGLAQATGGPALCPDARERLAWDSRRAEVERAFAGTQVSYAADTWTRISGELDTYADTWTAGHSDACESHAR